MKTLWLQSANLKGALKGVLLNHLKRANVNPINIYFKHFTANMLVKETKTKFTWAEGKRHEFERNVKAINPDFIVVNDRAALGFITRKYTSLALCRGSIFKYELNGKIIPCLVVDDIFKTKSTDVGSWILLQDLMKLRRWINGEQRSEPKFNHTVIRQLDEMSTFVSEVSSRDTLFISIDIETSGSGNKSFITCIGYTVIRKSGRIHTWVIPFYDGSRVDSRGCYWGTVEAESYVWEQIRAIHLSSIPKLFQNGSYDNTHLLTYRIASRNWILDTLNGMHSIWAESRKNIDFICSLFNDYYCYWKDEGKEDENENTKGGAVPVTPEGMENYWRYNALDCHNTAIAWLSFSRMLTKPELSWALRNYKEELTQVTGPAFRMSMTGVRVNQKLKTFFSEQNTKASDKAYDELTVMVGDPDFNPNSNSQVASLLYDVVRTPPIPRQKRSVDEKVLKLIQTQGPLEDIIVSKIWDVKKPANNVSKYGNYGDNQSLACRHMIKNPKPSGLMLLNGRWMYKMNGTGTETGRWSSKSHDLWIGTQIQNPPYSIRAMIEPDPGYYLVNIDYAQSDNWFTAFGLEEEKMIETVLSPRDTHCIHAAYFFKKNYEELIEAHKKKEDWVSHNVTGIRSVTKRVVYGSNYLMAGFTLFLTMGREAVLAAALHLGYEQAPNWTYDKFVQFCAMMIESYFQMYPGIRPRLKLEFQMATRNGNKMECAYGRTRLFFGDLLTDNKAQRELAAFIGQGGTAENINKALKNIYYGDQRLTEEFMVLVQMHDSFLFQVRKESLHTVVPYLQRQMENEIELHGRSFIVPTDAEVGLGWGKRMMEYKVTLSEADIIAYDKEWWDKNYYAVVNQN